MQMLVCLVLTTGRPNSQSKVQMFTLYSGRHVAVHGCPLIVIFHNIHHILLAFSIGWFSIFFLLRDSENDLYPSKHVFLVFMCYLLPRT